MNMTFKLGEVLFTAEKSEISDRETEISVRFNTRSIGYATRREDEVLVRHLVAGRIGSGLLATRQAPSDATDFELAALVAENWLNKKSFLENRK